MQLEKLPETGFLRLKQILVFIPVSKSVWWSGVKAGKFPKSVKMGSCTFWKAEDIRALIQKIGEEAHLNG